MFLGVWLEDGSDGPVKKSIRLILLFLNKLPFFPALEWIQNFHPELGKIIDVASHDGQSVNHGYRRD